MSYNRPVGVRSFVKNGYAKCRIQCRPLCSPVTWKPFKISSWNVIEILTNIKRCAACKNHDFWIYIFFFFFFFFFWSYAPLNKNGYAKNRIQCRPLCSSVTWKPFKISSWNIIEILTNIRRCADRKNHDFWIYIFWVMPLWTKTAMPRTEYNVVRSVTWKLFKISSWNVIEILTNIRRCADCKNHNSWVLIFWVMPLWTKKLCQEQNTMPSAL